MKGLQDLLQPITTHPHNVYGLTAYPTFQYHHMIKKSTLMDTIGQYPTELLSLLGNSTISDTDGQRIMECIQQDRASAGSDGSVKDGIGGHAFCISDHSFTTAIWGYAQTVGTSPDMTSLRAEHGGALGILLLIYAMHIHYQMDFPPTLTIYIDNSEVVRRGKTAVPRLGIKQQLVLDYDLWATTERIITAIPCIINWKWVKGHQAQGAGSRWRLDVALNSFCDKKAEAARTLNSQGDPDPFFPDQKCGITVGGIRQHGSPREAITYAAHAQALQDYITEKAGWLPDVFSRVDWTGLAGYMNTIPATR